MERCRTEFLCRFMKIPNDFSNTYIWIKSKACFATSSLFLNFKSVWIFRNMESICFSFIYTYLIKTQFERIAWCFQLVKLYFPSQTGQLPFLRSPPPRKKIHSSFWGVVETPSSHCSSILATKKSLQNVASYHDHVAICQINLQCPAIGTSHISFKKMKDSKPTVQHFPRHLLFSLIPNSFLCNQVNFNILYIISNW